MMSLTKNEISEYLWDYFVLCDGMVRFPDVSIGQLYNELVFSKIVKYNNILDYDENSYLVMLRVYYIVSFLRIFSYIKENFLDSLKEEDLDFGMIKNEIFVNQDDSRYFSNKQILNFIRNAFNHSDGNKELYKISRNGRYLEIDLKNTLPKPFHIKVNVQQLVSMYNIVLENINSLYLTFIMDNNFDYNHPWNYKNLDGLEIVRLYLPKKMESEIIDQINGICNDNNLLMPDMYGKIITFLEDNNVSYKVKKFNFNSEQCLRLQEIFRKWKRTGRLLSYQDDINFNLSIIAIVNSVFRDIIPLGLEKIDNLDFNIMYSLWFMNDLSLSFNDINSVFYDIIRDNDKLNDCRAQVFYDRYIQNELNVPVFLIKMVVNKGDRIFDSIIEYLSYNIVNMCREEILDINGKKYSREHIRNSLVHGRWFVGKDDILEMYDTKSGRYNDYDFYWHDSVSIRDLVDYFKIKVSSKNKCKRLLF